MHMHHLFRPSLYTVVMCLFLSACDNPNTAQDAGANIDSAIADTENRLSEAGDKLKAGSDEVQVQLSDAAITTKVKAALLADSDVASLDIQVNTLDGMVTLTGDVPTSVISEKVTAIAKAIAEVKQVSNELAIKA